MKEGMSAIRCQLTPNYRPTGCGEDVGACEAHSQRGEGVRVDLVGQPAAWSGDQTITHARGSEGDSIGRRAQTWSTTHGVDTVWARDNMLIIHDNT